MRAIQAAHSRPMPQLAGLVWPLLICALLAGLLSNAAAGEAPFTQPALGITELLATIEQQVASGHTTAPQDNNALETWKQVVRQASPPSAAAVNALADFVVQARSRAVQEKQAGRGSVASDFNRFADMANDVLLTQATGVGPTAPHPATQPSASALTLSATGSREQAAETHVTPADAPNHVVPPVASASASGSAISTAQSDVAAKQTVPAAAHVTIADSDPQSKNAAPVPDASLVAIYVTRGDAMLARKDVSAARKYYEYGAEAGNAHAAAALAGTFDPAVLARIGVVGLQPNPALARQWYERAATLGDAGAADRLQELQTRAGP